MSAWLGMCTRRSAALAIVSQGDILTAIVSPPEQVGDQTWDCVFKKSTLQKENPAEAGFWIRTTSFDEVLIAATALTPDSNTTRIVGVI